MALAGIKSQGSIGYNISPPSADERKKREKVNIDPHLSKVSRRKLNENLQDDLTRRGRIRLDLFLSTSVDQFQTDALMCNISNGFRGEQQTI
jgi:hypothetical protein